MINYHIRPRKNPLSGKVLYYPTAAITGNISMEEMAQNITDNCTVTIHDVRGVLSALQEHIVKTIRDGKSVRFGMLGSFRPTLRSNGVPVKTDFTPALIKKVNCRFTPSSKLMYELGVKNTMVKFKLIKEGADNGAPESGGEQTV